MPSISFELELRFGDVVLLSTVNQVAACQKKKNYQNIKLTPNVSIMQ